VGKEEEEKKRRLNKKDAGASFKKSCRKEKEPLAGKNPRETSDKVENYFRTKGGKRGARGE